MQYNAKAKAMNDATALILIMLAFVIGFHAGDNKLDKCQIEVSSGNVTTVTVGKYVE